MSAIDSNVGGTLEATTITASVQFTGPGTGLTNVPVGSITSLGTNNAAVITNGSGLLTVETHLAAVRGGTGTDSSGATGVAHITAGTWTYSGITTSDLAVGFSVTNAQTTATSSNTPSTIVARDGGGGFSAGTINATTLQQNATTVSPNGIYTHRVANVQTTTNSTTAIITFTTTNSSVLFLHAMISITDESDVSSNTGAISYYVKATTNGSGTVTISSLANQVTILDTNVSTASSTVTSTGANNVTINVVGIAAKTIDWMCAVEALSQA